MKFPARVIALFWSVVAFFFVAENVSSRLASNRPIDWNWDVFNEFLYWALWAALTPLIIYGFNRFPPRRDVSTIAAHSLIAVIVAVAQVAGMIALHLGDPMRTSHVVFLLFTAFWKYWVVIALLLAWRYARLYVDAQSRLEHVQLEQLKAQLQPHFLFNTLNSISVLARDNPSAAQEMIVRLSDLLRMSIDAKDAQFVTLREELEFTERYIDIQRVRFGDRLQVQLDVSREAFDVLVPHLLLQPLVENSIQYGISGAEAGRVEITAVTENQELIITIRDEASGGSRPADHTRGSGLGLANARSRLAWLYGGRAQLSFARNGEQGASVTIRLPVNV